MNLEPIRALLKYIRIGNEGDWNPSWRAATLIKAREAEIALSQLLEAVTDLENYRTLYLSMADDYTAAGRVYKKCAADIHRLLHPEDK